MSQSTSFVSNLIENTDNGRLELIGEISGTHIEKCVCAFLNGAGGWIVIGFNGDRFYQFHKAVHLVVNELLSKIANTISPKPLVDVRQENYKQHAVILISVVKGDRVPYTFDREFYVRDYRGVRIALLDEISILLRSSANMASTWERQTALSASFEDLDSRELEHCKNEISTRLKLESVPKSTTDFLSLHRLYDGVSIKNGAVILFGLKPTQFLPQCRIRITHMPHGKTGSIYQSLIIEDNLFASLVRMSNYFDHNLPNISLFKDNDWDRKDRPMYPSEVLDEAILNAVVHRDYGDFGGEITVNIKKDSIEVINSGEIPPNILEGKNTILEHHSVLRNPEIAYIFHFSGKMEKVGRGLEMVVRRCKEYGMKLPEWNSKNGYTSLTIFGKPDLIAINARSFKFLNSMTVGEFFVREDFENFFKQTDPISEKTARNDIAKMNEGGWIRIIGKARSVRYQRTNKELPDFAG